MSILKDISNAWGIVSDGLDILHQNTALMRDMSPEERRSLKDDDISGWRHPEDTTGAARTKESLDQLRARIRQTIGDNNEDL